MGDGFRTIAFYSRAEFLTSFGNGQQNTQQTIDFYLNKIYCIYHYNFGINFTEESE